MNWGKFDDEAKKKSFEDYTKHMTTVVAYFDKQLGKHGNHWIAGEKITIADFTVAAILASHVWNPAMPSGEAYWTKGEEIVASHTHFAAWAARIKEEVKGRLDTRHPAPF